MDDIALHHIERERQRALARLDMFEQCLRSVAGRMILASLPAALQRVCVNGSDEEWDAAWAAHRAQEASP